jgi:hypothetical protein
MLGCKVLPGGRNTSLFVLTVSNEEKRYMRLSPGRWIPRIDGQGFSRVNHGARSFDDEGSGFKDRLLGSVAIFGDLGRNGSEFWAAGKLAERTDNFFFTLSTMLQQIKLDHLSLTCSFQVSLIFVSNLELELCTFRRQPYSQILD